MGTFEIRKNAFYLDNAPFRILSGAMHYFRVHPAHWEDRMQKMQLMGLNTLETYVAWNMHEPKPGQFDFDGWMDLVKYIKIAGDLGLKVIVRPGPYICSEWEFGGLPAWLLKDPEMKLRCSYRPYLDAVERYFSELLPRLAPLQVSGGGPVIMMQIENEYGGYGNDTSYLEFLEKKMRFEDITVPLFTSDGSIDGIPQHGSLRHILKTVNFGVHAASQFNNLREYQPEGPLMCMEFWNGWFDHWGEDHHTRSPEDAAAVLDDILASGASVNFYMFHGGTNFGFMNGANYGNQYLPTITSYDYDAPLNEQGDITPKFRAFQEVIRKYQAVLRMPLPSPAPTLSIAPFKLLSAVSLLSSLKALSHPVSSVVPLSMECVGQSYGLILYETRITGPRDETPLVIREVGDRAHIFVDGKFVDVIEREFSEKKIGLTIPSEGITLRILVENMGRINYGDRLQDRKGITDCVILGSQMLHNWTIYPLPLDDLSGLDFSPAHARSHPMFYRGYFQVVSPRDAFFSPDGFFKGFCWINDFNIGRYWKRGPQQTLYVPGPVFREGMNEVVILELDGASHSMVSFLGEPVLSQ